MSFTSTYSSLSIRGWQSGEGGQQFYSQIASQFGPNGSQLGSFADISEYQSNTAGNFNLSVTSMRFQNTSNPARIYTTEFNGIKQTFTGDVSGGGIFGPFPGITFGSNLSISGDGKYIAATGNTNASLDQANLIIYSADANYNFTLQTSILSPTPNTDYFGSRDLNYDGTRLAQRTRGINQVDIYSRSGNTWSLSTSITPNVGNIPTVGFGDSISYSNNNTLVVGAGGNPSTPGTVFIFVNDSQVARIFPSVSSNNDSFGRRCRISADGDYLIVGAPGPDPGNVYVFGNVANTWTELALLNPTTSTLTSVDFGSEVAISNNGNTVIVSDTFARDISSNVQQGAVYVFSKDDSNNYIQVQEILNPVGNTSAIGQFGDGLSMTQDGKRMIAGDLYRKSGNTNTGALYLYQSFT
jgi:hypothetical protein